MLHRHLALAALAFTAACELPVDQLAEMPRISGAHLSGMTEDDSDLADEGEDALQMPAPQECLEGPDEKALHGDLAFAASAGLSPEQIGATMNGFIQNTTRCVEFDSLPEGTLFMELTVGCNGLVADIEVLDAGAWPDEAAACVLDVLRHAPFPAHDQPDGETFEYPLRFAGSP